MDKYTVKHSDELKEFIEKCGEELVSEFFSEFDLSSVATLEAATFDAAHLFQQKLIKALLEKKDDILFKNKPRYLKSDKKVERTIATTAGSVTFTRRYYKGKGDTYHYLLDEVMDIPNYFGRDLPSLEVFS